MQRIKYHLKLNKQGRARNIYENQEIYMKNKVEHGCPFLPHARNGNSDYPLLSAVLSLLLVLCYFLNI